MVFSAVHRLVGGLTISVLVAALAAGCRAAPESCHNCAALVVVVVVDQFTPAHLERYDAAFTGGLRRLLDEGRNYVNAYHDHASTSTAPGHATIATGVHPARHGLVGNTWFESVGDAFVEISSVTDSSVHPVGYDGVPGSSPRNLLRPALADWLLEQQPAARIVSVSGKDRSAILLAGRSQGEVYWFDDELGTFVTSTYYRARDVAWLREFGEQTLPVIMREECWNAVVADSAHGAFAGDAAYDAAGVFPRCFDADGVLTYAQWFARTPMLDHATLLAARAAVRSSELGQRGATDYLAIGLSQTDRVGHDFGPWSLQQFDNLLRLDGALGEFIAFLDETVGRSHYVLVLTADHGVMDLPENRAAQGLAGDRIGAALQNALRVAEEDAGRAGGSRADVRSSMAALLEKNAFVAQAIPLELLESDAPADSFVALFRRSYHPARKREYLAAHGVELRFEPGLTTRRRGTGHGTPYWHDRHVPLIVFGGRIAACRITEPVRTVDIAPTLAALAGVVAPQDLDGVPLFDPADRRGAPSARIAC